MDRSKPVDLTPPNAGKVAVLSWYINSTCAHLRWCLRRSFICWLPQLTYNQKHAEASIAGSHNSLTPRNMPKSCDLESHRSESCNSHTGHPLLPITASCGCCGLQDYVIYVLYCHRKQCKHALIELSDKLKLQNMYHKACLLPTEMHQTGITP